MACRSMWEQWLRTWTQLPRDKLNGEVIGGSPIGSSTGDQGLISATVFTPLIIGTTPSSNQGAVDRGVHIVASFNRVMEHSEQNAAYITVSGPSGDNIVASTVVWVGNTIVFTPKDPLSLDTTYLVKISRNVHDIAQVPMLADYSWTFNTSTIPQVTSRTPADGLSPKLTTNNPDFQLVFSKAMAPGTISPSTVIVERTSPSFAPIKLDAFTVTNTDTTYSFTALSKLRNGDYKMRVVSGVNGVKDTFGNTLQSDSISKFRIAKAPEIDSQVPADDAKHVWRNANISMTWDNPMTLAPFNDAVTKVTVKDPSNVAVAGTCTLSADRLTVTFTPTAKLALNTEYTVTVPVGMMDTTDTKTVAAETWTFTTSKYDQQPLVNLDSNSSGTLRTTSFAAIASSALTAAGTTTFMGNVGLTDSAATSLTGFADLQVPSPSYSTSASRINGSGRIYTTNLATPTPSELIKVKSNINEAMTQVSTRASPAPAPATFTSVVPGLYKMTTLDISENFILDGNADDVWVFFITGNLTQTAAGKIIIGNAVPSKVFWVVQGTASIDGSFAGILLAGSDVTVSGTNTFNGSVLSKGAVVITDTIINKA